MGVKSEVLGNIARRPFTKKYPKEKVEPFPRFRGKIVFDVNKCTGCGLCGMFCPTDAIKLRKKTKTMKVRNIIHRQVIHFIKSADSTKCMRCGLCVDVCPVDCIWFDTDFELADKNKENFVFEE